MIQGLNLSINVSQMSIHFSFLKLLFFRGKRKRSSDFLIITDDEETISKDNIEAAPRRSRIEGDIEEDDPVLIMSVSDLSKIIRSSRKRNINRY